MSPKKLMPTLLLMNLIFLSLRILTGNHPLLAILKQPRRRVRRSAMSDDLRPQRNGRRRKQSGRQRKQNKL